MPNEVKLIAQGPQGSGKTLLLAFIHRLLTENDFTCRLEEHTLTVDINDEDKQFLAEAR